MVAAAERYEALEKIWKEEIPSDPESVRDLTSFHCCAEESSSEEDGNDELGLPPSEEQNVSQHEEEKQEKRKDRHEGRSKHRTELDELMANERFRDFKMHKNQLTLKPRSPEWSDYYRQQEIERYAHPTRPWLYYNEDGTTSIVAPVCKKPSANVILCVEGH